jgi:dolichol-phosphate mannosyltransferase
MVFIILPVFNEEKTIEWTIGKIRSILQNTQYHIVVVNDGSTDRTMTILQKLKKNTTDLTIESYLINMNIGAVFQTGIHAVLDHAKNSDVIVIMESDKTSSPELLPKLISSIEHDKNDICIASRYIKGGAYKNFPTERRIFSYLASYLMQHTFPIDQVKDYTIFYRSYKASVLRIAITHFGKFGLIQSKGFVSNAELLVKLSFFTKRIAEIPFVYDYGVKKGRSKLGILKTINEYFVVLGYLRSIRNKMKSYLP